MIKVGGRPFENRSDAGVGEQEAQGFKAFERRDWRDVTRCSACGAMAHEVEKLIAGGGKAASGYSVTIRSLRRCLRRGCCRASCGALTTTSSRSPLRKKLVVERIRSDHDIRTL